MENQSRNYPQNLHYMNGSIVIPQGRIDGTGMPVPLHVFLIQPLPNDSTCQFQMNIKLL